MSSNNLLIETDWFSAIIIVELSVYKLTLSMTTKINKFNKKERERKILS